MSPARKREAVVKLVDKFATSERRACLVLGRSITSEDVIDTLAELFANRPNCRVTVPEKTTTCGT